MRSNTVEVAPSKKGEQDTDLSWSGNFMNRVDKGVDEGANFYPPGMVDSRFLINRLEKVNELA